MNGLLSDPLTPMCVGQGYQLSMLLCNIAVEALDNLINADRTVKGIQIGDQEIKIVNVADNTTIFLRHITFLNKIQGILKPYENAKMN